MPRSAPVGATCPRASTCLAFTAPLESVRVLIVGQDPYPTPGHPVGLSFSVDPGSAPSRGASPTSIASCTTTSACPPVAHGDLTSWSENGVMLLNRVLTVRPGETASHRGKGWEPVTQRAIEVLAARGGPLVAILWGATPQP